MEFTIRRAGHVVLRVTDPFRAREFLERVVGFQTFGQEGESFFFLTAHPVSNHHMIAVRGGKGERLPDSARQIGMVSVSYEVTDLDELRRLSARIADEGPGYGVSIVQPERQTTIAAFTVADADGNWLEFYSRLPDAALPAVRRVEAVRVGVRRTSHLTLRCKDQANSRAFYEEMLGLVVVEEAMDGRLALSGDPVTRLPVLVLAQARELGVPVPKPREMYGMEHFSMEVASFAHLQNVYRHLRERGAHVHHTIDHGVTNSVYVIDPDGNLIEVYHDVPRAEYRNPENPFGNFGPLEERLEATPA